MNRPTLPAPAIATRISGSSVAVPSSRSRSASSAVTSDDEVQDVALLTDRRSA